MVQMNAFRVIARRRATVPQYHQSEPTNAPPGLTPPTNLPSSSPNLSLPPVPRRSIKKFRKYYIANISSKHGSTQNQVITSGTYHKSGAADFIRLETSENVGGTLGVILLESRPNKGPNTPRLLRRLSQSNAVKSIGNLVPIAPNLGYFSSMRREASGSPNVDPFPATPQETITFQVPLALDSVVVLAGMISSRRSRRSLDSKSNTWFIETLWEGLKRLKAVHENDSLVDPAVSLDRDGGNTSTGIPALIDEIMPKFGPSLLHFHHKVLKIQQKRDHTMSASREQKDIVRQEIAERNQDILQTQASWHVAEQEREELRRRESLLRKRVLARNSTL
ncbi:unnamed protein product [Rhizoctonia solani]|uniref:Uncharacterized protein n=1 Tax=Rhizoctonia solani TaxID=456999 RepID=A0A8H3H8W7_9AGAM|nr:unnamed protein product [Rhizoctonia solani]